MLYIFVQSIYLLILVVCYLAMFTGIVERICEVKSIQSLKKTKSRYVADLRLSIDLGNLSKGLKTGKSISVNGACLTITELHNNIAEFELVGETVRRTNLGMIKKGDRLNIERSMRPTDRFDGHIVQGHVDCTGIINDKKVSISETKITIHIEDCAWGSQFMVSKGSITVDGVSLTIVDTSSNSFTIALIPHTLSNTTLGTKPVGEKVNIEFDIIGKYIANILPKN